MCPKTCPGFRAETRKSLSYLEAPVGIEPTNRGFAVDREPLRRTLSCSIPLHKPLSQNWTLPKRSRSRVEHKASLQILRIPRQDSILEIDLVEGQESAVGNRCGFPIRQVRRLGHQQLPVLFALFLGVCAATAGVYPVAPLAALASGRPRGRPVRLAGC